MKAIFSTNFRSKTKKIITAVFEKNIKVSDFGLIWRPFQEYLQMVTCYIYRPLISCKKSEKSIEPFLRKLRNQATNQPTNANLKTFSRISPNQEFFFQKSGSVTFLLYSLLTSCKKSEKSLEPFLRKLCYQPTNQPITKNTVFLEPDWRRSKKQQKKTKPVAARWFCIKQVLLQCFEKEDEDNGKRNEEVSLSENEVHSEGCTAIIPANV